VKYLVKFENDGMLRSQTHRNIDFINVRTSAGCNKEARHLFTAPEFLRDYVAIFGKTIQIANQSKAN